MSARIHGLYVIIDPEACGGRPPVEIARLALEGGASVIQWRDKQRPKRLQLHDARAIRELCAQHGAAFIVNDHADLAIATHADGVHVGQQDLAIEDVRRIVGEAAIIGVSTNTVEEARVAADNGASYVAVGALFPTGSKVGTRPASLVRLLEIRRAVTTPIVGIGGINERNLTAVVTSGANAAAVISAVCAAADPRAAAERLAAMFVETEAPRVPAHDIRRVVRAYVDAVNSRDRAGFLALFAPDGVREDPPSQQARVGREAIGCWWDETRLGDRPFTIRVRNMVVVRQEAALYWTIQHEHDDGSPALASGVEVISVDDNGAIASVRSYWNRSAHPGTNPRDTAERVIAALNARNAEAYANLWAAEGMWQSPIATSPIIGVHNIREAFDALMSVLPECKTKIDDICVSGPEAAIAWTTTSANAAGSGVDVIALDDAGKIASLHSYSEPWAM